MGEEPLEGGRGTTRRWARNHSKVGVKPLEGGQGFSRVGYETTRRGWYEPPSGPQRAGDVDLIAGSSGCPGRYGGKGSGVCRSSRWVGAKFLNSKLRILRGCFLGFRGWYTRHPCLHEAFVFTFPDVARVGTRRVRCGLLPPRFKLDQPVVHTQ